MAALTFVSCAEEDPVPPSADFTFVIADKAVTFTNTSADADSYVWDFDDDMTSTDMNPTHTFAAYGDYDVRLTATNTDGDNTKKQTISVVKEWPTIAIDGDFTDWADVETMYSGFGDASGSLSEAKVTSDAAGSVLYFYIKGTINADYPVIQIMVNADGDTTTGWKTPLDYASNGVEYQVEFYALDGWGGLYGWGSDAGIQDWPWVDDLTPDADLGVVESSAVIGESEMEFAIQTSVFKAPVLAADKIGIYFWMQPADWSATSGSLPAIMTDPLNDIGFFSFQ